MKGELDEAIDNFSECIKYGPSLIDGYIYRGDAYLEKVKTLTKRSDQVALKRQALEDYGKAVSLGYDEPNILRERGELFAEIGETRLAINELRQAAQQYKLKGLNRQHESTLSRIKDLQKQLKENSSSPPRRRGQFD